MRPWALEPVPRFPFQPFGCTCFVAVGSSGSTNSHSQRSSLRSAGCRPHPSPRTDQSEACIVPGKPDLKKQRGERNPCLQWGTTLLCSARESPCLPGAASRCWGGGRLLPHPTAHCLPTVGSQLSYFWQKYVGDDRVCLALNHSLSSEKMPSPLFGQSGPGKRGS